VASIDAAHLQGGALRAGLEPWSSSRRSRRPSESSVLWFEALPSGRSPDRVRGAYGRHPNPRPALDPLRVLRPSSAARAFGPECGPSRFARGGPPSPRLRRAGAPQLHRSAASPNARALPALRVQSCSNPDPVILRSSFGSDCRKSIFTSEGPKDNRRMTVGTLEEDRGQAGGGFGSSEGWGVGSE